MKRVIYYAIVLLGVAGIGLLLLRRFGGATMQRANRPESGGLVLVQDTDPVSALDVDTVAVMAYACNLCWGTPIYVALNYGGEIGVEWKGKDQLIVHLLHSERLHQLGVRSLKWRGATISYEEDDSEYSPFWRSR